MNNKFKKTLETERLILRPWRESDAKALFKYASNPNIGPIAGWPVHTSEENSLDIIRGVLSAPETYAVVLKESGEAIGSIGLITAKSEIHSAEIGANEGEIGYWIGEPYWGRGLIPEAVHELLRHGFVDVGLDAIWCGYYDGNEKSRRVQVKCGFHFHHTEQDKSCLLMGDIRTEHFMRIRREEWSR